TQNKSAQVNSQLSGLITQNPAADAVSYNFYNAENQLIGSVNAEGYAIDYAYDKNGNVSQKTNYSIQLLSVSLTQTWESLRPQNDIYRQVLQQSYDQLGRLDTTTFQIGDGNGVNRIKKTKNKYDDKTGQLSSTAIVDARVALKRAANTAYDQYGRVIGTLAGNGSDLLDYTSNPTTIAQIWKDYGVAYTYDSANRRTSSIDQNGHRTLYYYDQAGHLTFTVNAMGEVTEQNYNHLGQLTDTIQYANRLTSLNALNGGLQTADFNQKVQAIANSADNIRTSNAYDLDGRLVAVIDPNNQLTRYTYDQFGQQVKITDVKQIDTELHYDKRGLVTDTIRDAANLHQTVHTDYDAFGRAWRTVDAMGNVTQQKLDKLGQVVEVKDVASGSATKTAYDAFSRVLTKIDAKGAVTQFGYQWGPRVIAVTTTSAEGVFSNVAFLRTGEKDSESSTNSGVSYLYDKDGNLIGTSRSTPNGGTSKTNIYDKSDRLTQSTDENGNITTYTYDDADRLLTKTLNMTNGQPLVTSYKYDAFGHQVEITDPENRTTRLVFDHKGQLLQSVSDPNGLNLVTEYNYDETGKTLKITQRGNANVVTSIQSYTYDALGRRITESQDGGVTINRQYQYDANNNVISIIDAQGLASFYAYDSQNRQILNINAAGNIVRTTYDANGRITQVRRYASTINTANISRPADSATLLALIPSLNVNDQVSYRYYDKDGRMTIEVSAIGEITTYAYDGEGHVVRNTKVATKITLPPPADFSLSSVPFSALDLGNSYSYDVAGHLGFKIDTNGSVTGYVYDKVGNLTTTTVFVSKLGVNDVAVGARADVVNLLMDSKKSAEDRVERRAYDEANRLIYIVDAQGHVSQNVYVGLHLAQTVQYGDTIAINSSDSNTIKNAIGINAAIQSIVGFTYDKLGQLLTKSITDSSGKTQVYSYNSLGQLLSFKDVTGVTWTYTYDTRGRRSSESLDGGLTISRSYKYDASNNFISITDAQGNATHYAYDNQNREILKIDAAGIVTGTAYDANGQISQTLRYASNINGAAIGNIADSTSLLTLATGLVAKDGEAYRYFDKDGHQLAEVNAQGEVTNKVFDVAGNLARATRYASKIAVPPSTDFNLSRVQNDLLDYIESFAYDAAGRLGFKLSSAGEITGYLYDQTGQLVNTTLYASRINLKGLALGIKADAVASLINGNVDVLSNTDAQGKTESYTYNAQRQKTSYINKNGETWTYSYDAAGALERVTNTLINGVSTTFDYGAYRNGQQNLSLVNIGTGKNGEVTAVDLATGNLVLRDTDALLSGRGDDVSILRSYNSQGKLHDDNADAWWLNGYRRVAALTGELNKVGSSVYRAGQDGTVVKYNYDSNRQLYVAAQGSGSFDTLSCDGSSWTWKQAGSQRTETYQGGNAYTWRLATASDLNGQTTTYSYSGDVLSRITNANGEAVEFVYAGNNLTQERILAADGKVTSNTNYRYDAQNRLSQVLLDLSPDDASIADGKVYATSYTYVGIGNLIESITQTDGSSQKFSYAPVNGESRIASITDAYNNVTKFDYDTVNRQTKVTDAFGNVSTYTTNTDKRFETVIAPAANGQTANTRYTYDAAGNIASLTDAQNNVTSFTYDASGNQLTRTDAQGNRVENTYNGNNDLLTSTLYSALTADGKQLNGPQTTRYVYDAQHNLRFQINSTGNVSERRYDSNGQKIAELHFTDAKYGNGVLSPSLDQMQSWSSSQTQEATSRTDYGYNSRGQVTSITTYSKVGSDGLGIKNGTESITQYSYDVSGKLLFSIDGQNNQTSYTYDGLGRVLSTTDALQKTSYTEYDDANHKVILHNASGRIDTQLFDSRGHLLNSTLGGELTTEYRYDALGRQVYSRDPSGVEQLHIYDAAGNIQADINGQGEVTQYVYNSLGQKIQTIARANALTASQFQQIKVQVVQETAANATAAIVNNIPVTASSSDMVSRTLYDSLGRIGKTISPLGEVTEFQYNAAGKLVSTVQRVNTLNPSTIGINATAQDVTVAADAVNDRISYCYYDQDQKLIGKIDAEGGIVEYRYDNAGRLRTTVAYATKNKNAKVDSRFSSLLAASSGKDVIDFYFYDASDRIIAYVNPEGTPTEYIYDQAGHVTQKTTYNGDLSGGFGLSVSWDRVRPDYVDPNRQTVTQTFDKLGRLETTNTFIGEYRNDNFTTKTKNIFDAQTGLLISNGIVDSRAALRRTQDTAYDKFGRVIATVKGNGSELLRNTTDPVTISQIWKDYGTAYTYDAGNRRTSSTDQNGHRTLYYYDNAGHLTFTINALGEVTEQRYNHLGQLTDKVQYATRLTGLSGLSGGLQTADFTQKIQAIADQTNDIRSSYSYDLDGRMVTMTDANNQLTTYTYDQFGEQVKVTDAKHIDTELHYDKRGAVTDTIRDTANLHQTVHTDYDAFGRAWRTVDAMGNVTQQQFDRLGRVVEVKDMATGSATTSKYDAFGRIFTQTDALGVLTSYWYLDSRSGDQTAIVSVAGQVRGQVYINRVGDIRGHDYSEVNSDFMTYDYDGNLLTRNHSAVSGINTTANIYDKSDRLTQSTDENGNITTYAYDDADRLTSKTLAMAGGQTLVTSYKYDAFGRQVQITDADNKVTKLVYDHKGQLLQSIVDPDGLHLITEYSYDEAGKTLKVTQKGNGRDASLVQSYTYDALGRRISESSDDGITTSRKYAYDANNNVISVIDANGNVAHYAYDSQNRQVISIDAAGGVTTTAYDPDGRISQLHRYAAAINTAGIGVAADKAALNALIPAASANDQISYRYYDNDGHLAVEVNALGNATSYTYDPEGHVVRSIQYATKITVPPMAALSISTLPIAVQDQVESYAYEPTGRMGFKIAADGAVTGYAYDKVGNLTATTSYANHINVQSVALGARADAVLSLMNSKKSVLDHTERRAYDEANRLVYTVDAQGLVTQNIYDGLHLKQTVQYANAISVSDSNYSTIKNAISADGSKDKLTSYVYDKAGRLISVTDYQGKTESYTYNSLGQKASYTDKNGVVITYAYDKAGNLLAHSLSNTDVQGKTETYTYNNQGQTIGYATKVGAVYSAYTYDTSSNVLTQTTGKIDAQGNIESKTYDKNNQLLSTTDKTGNVSNYDNAGRLQSFVDTQGKTETYTYNAVGQIANVTNKQGEVSTYNYDSAGTLKTITAVTANGTVVIFDDSVYAASQQNLSLLNIVAGKNGEIAAVNLATGNLVLRDADALLSGLGNDISILRTYNSQGKLSDDNRDAWWLNGYRRVAALNGELNKAGSSVYRAGQDGSVVKYIYDSTRQLYVSTQGSGQFDTLSSDGTTWTWTDTVSHQTETYQGSNGTWKLANASDVSGNVTTYNYNGELLSKITNANGETVEFIYTGNNLSQERIVAADGKVTSNTRYSYDTQNRLSQVLLDLSPEDAS
ncbi:hypothetical protein ACO0LD_31530, partial [Undibacterium sp. Ji83W]|uniref:hypothetical protein n=1 Tax=Undibacterium sp. Ji83W TaxID=3413043 RepID=UPI003BF1EECB